MTFTRILLSTLLLVATFSLSGCSNKAVPNEKEFTELFENDILDDMSSMNGLKFGDIELQSYETKPGEAEVSFSVELIATEDFYGKIDDIDDYFDDDLIDQLDDLKKENAPIRARLSNLPADLKEELEEFVPESPFSEIKLLELYSEKGDSFFIYGEAIVKQRGKRWKLDDLTELDKSEIPDWCKYAEPESKIDGEWLDANSKEAQKTFQRFADDYEELSEELAKKVEAAEQRVIAEQEQRNADQASKLQAFLKPLKNGSIFDGIIIDKKSLQSRKVRMEVLSINESGFAEFSFTDLSVPGSSRTFNAQVTEDPQSGDLQYRAVSGNYQRNAGLFFGYTRQLDITFELSDQSISSTNKLYDINLDPVAGEALDDEIKKEENFYTNVLNSIQPGMVYSGLMSDTAGNELYDLDAPVVEVTLSFKRIEQEGRMVEAILSLTKDLNTYRPLNGSVVRTAFKTGDAPIALKPSADGPRGKNDSIFRRRNLTFELSRGESAEQLKGHLTGSRNRDVELILKLVSPSQPAATTGNDNSTINQASATTQPSMTNHSNAAATSYSSASNNSSTGTPASNYQNATEAAAAVSSTSNNGSAVSIGSTTGQITQPQANNTQNGGAIVPASQGLYAWDNDSWKFLSATNEMRIKNDNVLTDVLGGIFSPKKTTPQKEKLLTIAYPPRSFTVLPVNQTLTYVGNGQQPTMHSVQLNSADNVLEATLYYDAYSSQITKNADYNVADRIKVPLTMANRGTYKEIQAIIPPQNGWYLFSFDDYLRDSKVYLIKFE
ncbi:hypothetical protein ACWPKO_05690 [Coraliomargarita sp. W4R53]